MRYSCRQLLRRADDGILFGGSRRTGLVVVGTAPPDAGAFCATLSIPNKTVARLTINRPRPEDGKAFLGEVLHKVRFFGKVEGVFLLTNLRSIRYRQGLGVAERIGIIRGPVTRPKSLVGSGGKDTDTKDIRASVRT